MAAKSGKFIVRVAPNESKAGAPDPSTASLVEAIKTCIKEELLKASEAESDVIKLTNAIIEAMCPDAPENGEKPVFNLRYSKNNEDGDIIPLKDDDCQDITVGHYKMAKGLVKDIKMPPKVKYVYIPRLLLENPNFSFRETFQKLGFELPPSKTMAFHCQGIFDVKNWNCRLPTRVPNAAVAAIKTQGTLFKVNGVNLERRTLRVPPNQQRPTARELQRVFERMDTFKKEIETMSPDSDAYNEANEKREQLRQSLHHFEQMDSLKNDIATMSPDTDMYKAANEKRDKLRKYLHHFEQMDSLKNDIATMFPGTDAHKKANEELEKLQQCRDKSVESHRDMVKDGFKRMIGATSSACCSRHAIFKVDTNWSPIRTNFLAQCLAETNSKVHRLGLAEIGDFNEKLWDIMKHWSIESNNKQAFEIDTTWFADAKKAKDKVMEAVDDVVNQVRAEVDAPTGSRVGSTYSTKERAAIDQNIRRIEMTIESRWFMKDERGAYIHTLPDPLCTHLIVSDDRDLLEKKFEDEVQSALLLVNGGPYMAVKFCTFLEQGRPVFIFKYTGGVADGTAYVRDLEKGFRMFKMSSFNRRVQRVRYDEDGSGFTRDEYDIYKCWLKRFSDEVTFEKIKYQLMYDELELYNDIVRVVGNETRWLEGFKWFDELTYERLDRLLDNWPTQNNLENVVTVDLFNMRGRELQDQILRAMTVSWGDRRRLTYAWRLRHLLKYNADRQRVSADTLMLLIILFTVLATACSVIYTHFSTEDNARLHLLPEYGRQTLLKLNIILPVVVTVLQGVYAYLDPTLKYWLFKNAAVRVESEIYCYRAKVGQYDKHKDFPQDPEPSVVVSKKGAKNVPDANETFKSSMTVTTQRISAREKLRYDSDEESVGRPRTPRVDEDCAQTTEVAGVGGRGVGGLQIVSASGRGAGSRTEDTLGVVAYTPTRDRGGSTPTTARGGAETASGINTKNVGDSTKISASLTAPPYAADVGRKNPPRKKFADAVDFIYSQASERETLVYPRNWLLGVDLEPMKDVRKRLDKNKPTQLFMNQLFARKSVSWYQLFSQHCCQRVIHSFDMMWLRLWSCDRRGITGACYRGMWGACQCSGSGGASKIHVGGDEWDAQCADCVVEDNGDDGIDFLTADAYFKKRLLPLIAEMSHDAPNKGNWLQGTTCVVIGLSVCSSLFSSFDLITFVPLALCVSSAITQFVSHKQFELRLMQVNSSTHQLRKLVLWWNSLKPVETGLPVNKEHLVEVTEAAVAAQVVGQVMTERVAPSGSKATSGNDGNNDGRYERRPFETAVQKNS